MITVRVIDKTLSWEAPSENEDGSPLTDLAGFRVYWGASSRSYDGSQAINSPAVTEWDVTLAAGSYFFAVTALNDGGDESGFSNEVLKEIP